MNEQIRALMIEAGYAAPELAGRAIKLAELILKDCVDRCETVAEVAELSNKGEMARKCKATARSCADMIKSRYGL